MLRSAILSRLLLCLLACLPFALNFLAWTTGDYDRVQALRRYGEDMSVATSAYLERLSPSGASPVKLSSAEGRRYGLDLDAFILASAQKFDLHPWQFWRTLPVAPPPRPGLVVHRSNDDVGRARLAEWGFRLLGGVAPFLLLGLAAFACLPVLAWVAWEMTQAGHPAAAVAFAMAAGCSPFFVESMALPYSAFGFYLVALLAVTAFSVHAILGRTSPAAFFARALASAAVFTLCALCRDGVLLFLPGLFLAMAIGAHRITAASGGSARARHGRALALAMAGVLLVPLPYLLLRPSSHHELWTGMWEGLGDFDRTKGHVWADRVAIKLLLDAGFDREVPREVEIFDRDIAAPEKEAFFRKLVLQDIRSDPAWFVGILAQRAFATVTQNELVVLGGRADRSERARRGVHAPIPPNQGNIRFFYRLVPTADWIGFGPWRWASPLLLWWTAGLSALAVIARARPGLGLVALCVAASALTLPVLVTTAGALEAEAFVVVYFLGLAAIADLLWRKAAEVVAARRAAPATARG